MPTNLIERYGQFELEVSQHPKWKRVMCFGDSWFQYPGTLGDASDIPKELARAFRKTLFFGEGLAGRDRQSFEIGKKRIIREVGSFAFNVLALSHGGNDIVGPDMKSLVKKKAVPQAPAAVRGDEPQQVLDYIDLKEFAARMKRIRADYTEIIEKARKASPACEVVVHGYARIFPSDTPFELGPIEQGPWVYRFLKKAGLADETQQKVITDWMLNEFAKVLAGLGDKYGFVHIVNSLDALPKQTDWDNEIHPTKTGFQRIVDRCWKPVLTPLLQA